MSNNLFTNLLSDTDNLVENYLFPKEWQGTLPVQSCGICKRDQSFASVAPESIDLFDYCKGGKKSMWYGKNDIVRFDPTSYPLPENGDNFFAKGSSGDKLVTDLLAICHFAGQSTYCSNGSVNNKNSRRLTCHHYFCYNSEEKSEKIYGSLALRKIASTNKSAKSKRTLTGRATSSDKRCGAYFVINVDEQSYYMTIGTGHGVHGNHAPHDVESVATPKRLHPTDAVKNIQTLAYFKVSTQSIVTMTEKQFNCTITRRQVCSMAKFSKMAASIETARLIPKGNMSSPDQMVSYFKKQKIPHIVLSHHKDVHPYELKGQALRTRKGRNGSVSDDTNKENTTTIDIGTTSDDANNKNATTTDIGFVTMECGDFGHTTLLADDDHHTESMILYGNESRESMKIANDQTVMLSIMWCMPHHLRMFRAFPEVLYVDGTHSTNKDKMPLLTVGVRDEAFKMHIVIRAFIPNERAWLFRWIFQYGIPTLMGADACKRVKLIVTDGDSQETSQLDAA